MIIIRIIFNYPRMGWNYIRIAYLYLRMLLLIGLFRTLDYILAAFFSIWGRTPWYMAYVYAAFEEYTKTSLYRERLVKLGKEFAYTAYLGEGSSLGDRPHFKWKVRQNRKLMLKIIFAPYSVEMTEAL